MGPNADIIFFAVSALLLAVYSGAFTALEVLSLGRHERGPDGEDEADDFVDRLLADPMLFGIGLGLARTAAFALTVWAAIRLASGRLFFDDARFALTTVFVLAAVLVPVFLARLAAVRSANRFLAGARLIVLPTAYVMKPLGAATARLVGGMSSTLLRMLSFQLIPLKDKIEAFGQQDGRLVDEEQLIMSSIAEFGETRVREVMVPRIDIVAVNVATDQDESLQTIIDTGHSRIPVYDDTIDRIVGTLYTKDLLRMIHAGEDFSLRDLVRESFFVPESKMIDDLLTEFKVRKQHLAIVVDEYGGTAGIVTLEDVLEELVGDIQDEFDEEEELVRRIDDDSVVCNAKVRVDELNDILGLDLPDDVADTLGGLLYDWIGDVPEVGHVHRNGVLAFEVESVERQRIDTVVIRGLSEHGHEVEDRAG